MVLTLQLHCLVGDVDPCAVHASGCDQMCQYSNVRYDVLITLVHFTGNGNMIQIVVPTGCVNAMIRDTSLMTILQMIMKLALLVFLMTYIMKLLILLMMTRTNHAAHIFQATLQCLL